MQGRKKRAERVRICAKRLKSRCSAMCVALAMLAFLGFEFGRDVALIVIHSENECTLDTALGRSEYVSFGLSEWIWIAVGVHLSMLLAPVLGALIAACNNLQCVDLVTELMSTPTTCIPTVLCAVGVCAFLFAWTIIGFILLSEMGRDGHANKQCHDVVLAWTGMQRSEYVIVQYLACSPQLRRWRLLYPII